ncbi:hypothetical protein RchiOBHm_Chr4g0385491 [Rosa chinensis]|uniref:Uncharacterized protein n=1 Tax=Rosa chinensis TaxID=74649 RepID=A0A2P6QNY7_ROSCH|nr:hypothetical protein RchiOBHm_Chr4g0385491 [Rosa chinensis]
MYQIWSNRDLLMELKTNRRGRWGGKEKEERSKIVVDGLPGKGLSLFLERWMLKF